MHQGRLAMVKTAHGRSLAADTRRRVKHKSEVRERVLLPSLDSQGAQEEHCAMAVVLQPELDKLQLGYNVLHGGSLGFACIRETIRQGHDPKLCEHTPSSVSVRRSLDGMQQLHSNLKPLPLGGHAMGSSTCNTFSMIDHTERSMPVSSSTTGLVWDDDSSSML